MNDPFYARLMAEVAKEVRAEAVAAGQMTLGRFIKALSELPAGMDVRFPFGGAPCRAHSYRGYYDQLAFEAGPIRTVAEVLCDAKDALGHTFEGYKGGDFMMDADTMIWAASYGSCGSRIVGVSVLDGVAVLETAPDED